MNKNTQSQTSLQDSSQLELDDHMFYLWWGMMQLLPSKSGVYDWKCIYRHYATLYSNLVET